MTEPTTPTSSPQPQPDQHGRRPPLAEIDSWELWQAWRRGERARVLPWMGLLAGFCIVLAAMYAFFFVSSVLSGDTVFPIVLLAVYLGFLYWVWRRISPRRDFALGVVLVMVAVSAAAFGLWFLAYALSGYSIWVGIFGTAALGIVGLVVALPALNTIARRS
jgi:hypothetical protein